MVDRYDISSVDGTWDDNYYMAYSEFGEFVSHSDYKSLEDDYNILRRDYQAMMGKLKDIWVEG